MHNHKHNNDVFYAFVWFSMINDYSSLRDDDDGWWWSLNAINRLSIHDHSLWFCMQFDLASLRCCFNHLLKCSIQSFHFISLAARLSQQQCSAASWFCYCHFFFVLINFIKNIDKYLLNILRQICLTCFST